MKIIKKEYILRDIEKMHLPNLSSGSGFISFNDQPFSIVKDGIYSIKNGDTILTYRYDIKYKFVLLKSIKIKLNKFKWWLKSLICDCDDY